MTDLAEEYGKGLYDLTEEEHVSEDVLAQLRVLRGLFRDQPDFIRLLCNMSLAKEERTAILDGALRGQVHPYVLNFLKILCERGALHEFEGCVSAFTALYNQAHGIVPKTIIKGVREILEISKTAEEDTLRAHKKRKLTEQERAAEIAKLEKEMKEASKMLEFEYAAVLRDRIIELRGEK